MLTQAGERVDIDPVDSRQVCMQEASQCPTGSKMPEPNKYYYASLESPACVNMCYNDPAALVTEDEYSGDSGILDGTTYGGISTFYDHDAYEWRLTDLSGVEMDISSFLKVEHLYKMDDEACDVGSTAEGTLRADKLNHFEGSDHWVPQRSEPRRDHFYGFYNFDSCYTPGIPENPDPGVLACRNFDVVSGGQIFSIDILAYTCSVDTDCHHSTTGEHDLVCDDTFDICVPMVCSDDGNSCDGPLNACIYYNESENRCLWNGTGEHCTKDDDYNYSVDDVDNVYCKLDVCENTKCQTDGMWVETNTNYGQIYVKAELEEYLTEPAAFCEEPAGQFKFGGCRAIRMCTEDICGPNGSLVGSPGSLVQGGRSTPYGTDGSDCQCECNTGFHGDRCHQGCPTGTDGNGNTVYLGDEGSCTPGVDEGCYICNDQEDNTNECKFIDDVVVCECQEAGTNQGGWSGDVCEDPEEPTVNLSGDNIKTINFGRRLRQTGFRG